MSHKYAAITVKRKQCKRRIDERRRTDLQATARAKTDTIPRCPGASTITIFIFVSGTGKAGIFVGLGLPSENNERCVHATMPPSVVIGVPTCLAIDDSLNSCHLTGIVRLEGRGQRFRRRGLHAHSTRGIRRKKTKSRQRVIEFFKSLRYPSTDLSHKLVL